jgi:3-oxoacid CoA-transferase subunit B
MVITDLGVMAVTPSGLKLLELAPGVTVDEIKAKTAAKLDVSAV